MILSVIFPLQIQESRGRDVLANVGPEVEGTELMALFCFDQYGSKWLMEGLRHTNGSSPMLSSKCCISIGLSSIPATHLRLLLCGFSCFEAMIAVLQSQAVLLGKPACVGSVGEGLCLACMKPWVRSPAQHKQEEVVHTCNTGSWCWRHCGLEEQGHHQLHRDF